MHEITHLTWKADNDTHTDAYVPDVTVERVVRDLGTRGKVSTADKWPPEREPGYWVVVLLPRSWHSARLKCSGHRLHLHSSVCHCLLCPGQNLAKGQPPGSACLTWQTFFLEILAKIPTRGGGLPAQQRAGGHPNKIVVFNGRLSHLFFCNWNCQEMPANENQLTDIAACLGGMGMRIVHRCMRVQPWVPGLGLQVPISPPPHGGLVLRAWAGRLGQKNRGRSPLLVTPPYYHVCDIIFCVI